MPPAAPSRARAPPQDTIHDVAYDHCGQRIATCSSDQTIRVFNQSGRKTAEWKAHYGSIWRLAWAHPEFGQVLASCSFDRKVCIWEEIADAESASGGGGGARPSGLAAAGHQGWRLQAELQEARDSLHDIRFSPSHQGLRLASCGADRMVRVYDAPDVMDLSRWSLHKRNEFQPDATVPSPGTARANMPQCLAWSGGATPTDAVALVVGMTDGAVCLWALGDAGWTHALTFETQTMGGQVRAE
jgi:nucleoporin SEH1